MSVEAINAKKVVVEEITGKFNDSQSAVVVEYRGLSVAEVTELRKSLREEDVEFKVYKNKLSKFKINLELSWWMNAIIFLLKHFAIPLRSWNHSICMD